MSHARSAAFILLLVIEAVVLGGPGPGSAETLLCTPIVAVPTTITTSGNFCLVRNLTTTITFGPAIEIAASQVTLDFNGFRLDGLGAGAGTQANGVHAADRQNITIRNGTIRGFFDGIVLAETSPGASQGHVVEDMRLDRNTVLGLTVMGRGHLVRRNHVVGTGGSTVLGLNASAFGINVLGVETRVVDNEVIGTTKQGSGVTVGILLDAVADVLAVGNRITRADIGIQYSSGATGKFRDNLTSDVATPFVGGTNAGNNN
jgi:hypothetical protein